MYHNFSINVHEYNAHLPKLEENDSLDVCAQVYIPTKWANMYRFHIVWPLDIEHVYHQQCTTRPTLLMHEVDLLFPPTIVYKQKK